MPGEYDFTRMQEEAVRRAREMQARARGPVRQNRPSQERPSQGRRQQPEPPQEPTPVEEPSVEPDPQASQGKQAPEPQAEAAAGSLSSGGLLESLFQDKERTVILALLILLSGEEGSHELMFALLFLLM